MAAKGFARPPTVPSNRYYNGASVAKGRNILLMTSIESFDYSAEQRRLSAFQRRMEQAATQDSAIQAALAEHPIVSLVRGLPVESSSYPAIEYLRLAEQVGETVEDVRRKVVSGEMIFTGLDGSEIVFEEPVHNYIGWCMPGHDLSRPHEKGCGFIRSPSGSVVYSACPDDVEHYCKGKRRHCWSLRCPNCMNDTALRRGVETERYLLAYRRLMEKQDRYVGDIGHWVVSPPQEFAKCMVQTEEEFDALEGYINDSLQSIGALAGVTFFHPWRQKDDVWRFSPHFHILCYGRLDTRRFLKENPGWIIKKVHPRERIRSIRHTVAYLTTHMGLGMSERDPDTVDWDLDILDHLIPGLKSPGARYSERDHEDLASGKGRMAGDVSGIDWTVWTEDRLGKDMRVRTWGGVARNRIRTVAIHRQYRIRVCRECGAPLRTYEGSEDSVGSYVRYIQDNPIMVFSEHFEQVRSFFLRFKDDIHDSGLSLSDVASMIPFAVSSLEFTPQNNDLVMSGPFDEPDELFIRRQQAAYGPME